MKYTKLLLGLSLSAIVTAANAGYKQPAPVMVDMDAMFAGGDMLSARYSEDENAFIGCGTRHFADGFGGVYSFGFCQAGAGDVSMTCFTEDPELLAKMSNINDNSYLSFGWNENEECTRLGFSTQSFYLNIDKKDVKNKKEKKADE